MAQGKSQKKVRNLKNRKTGAVKGKTGAAKGKTARAKEKTEPLTDRVLENADQIADRLDGDLRDVIGGSLLDDDIIGGDLIGGDPDLNAWLFTSRKRAPEPDNIGAWNNTVARLLDQASKTPSGTDILHECLETAELLVSKNAAYGDSALNPLRMFSKGTPEQQILTRIDDKLSRVSRGEEAGEDVVKDLIGYFILLRIARRRAAGAKAEATSTERPLSPMEALRKISETIKNRAASTTRTTK